MECYKKLVESATTEQLKVALATHKEMLKSSFSYEDYDEVSEQIAIIEKELEERNERVS